MDGQKRFNPHCKSTKEWCTNCVTSVFAELHFKLVTSQLFLSIWNAAVIIEKSLLKSLLRTSEKKVIRRNKSQCSKLKNLQHLTSCFTDGQEVPSRHQPWWLGGQREVYQTGRSLRGTKYAKNTICFFFSSPNCRFLQFFFHFFFYFSHSSTFRCWGTRWRGNSTTPTERQVLTPIEPTLRSSSSTEPRGQM